MKNYFKKSHPHKPKKGKGSYSRNQCDGCGRGMPLNDKGVHIGKQWYDSIGCTKSRYEND